MLDLNKGSIEKQLAMPLQVDEAYRQDNLTTIEEALLNRGAAVIRHSRSSLYQHLLGTQEILLKWKQPRYVELAGLFHSVYSTDAFATELFSFSERQIVRNLVGPQAERLAFLFCTTNRRELLDKTISAFGEASAKGTVCVLIDRRDGASYDVTKREIQDLLILHLANIAEQSCTEAAAPSDWLTCASAIAAALAAIGDEDVLPIISEIRTITLADERSLRLAYANSMAVGVTSDAHIDLTHAAEKVPWVAEPWIWLGLLAVARAEVSTASYYGNRAKKLLTAWGVAWDKRLAESHWLRMSMLLCACGALVGDQVSYLAGLVATIIKDTPSLPEGLYTRLDGLGAFAGFEEGGTTASASASVNGAERSPSNLLPTRFQLYLNGLRTSRQVAMNTYPGLCAKPWWNVQDVPLTSDLERYSSDIAAEFRSIDPVAFHQESETAIRREGDWNVLMLYERGKRNERNCAFAPITASIIESHRTVKTQSGLAYFSRMAPGTKILPHNGPTNTRLRCHLGILVPDNCGISVDGITKSWQQGRCLVFDDSFTHHAWNSSTSERVVLIVDVWHPDLSDHEVELIEGLHVYIDAVANGLNHYWDTNAHAQRMGAP